MRAPALRINSLPQRAAAPPALPRRRLPSARLQLPWTCDRRANGATAQFSYQRAFPCNTVPSLLWRALWLLCYLSMATDGAFFCGSPWAAASGLPSCASSVGSRAEDVWKVTMLPYAAQTACYAKACLYLYLPGCNSSLSENISSALAAEPSTNSLLLATLLSCVLIW